MPIQKITKEEILQKSQEVFWRQGYFNTSMSDLAAACGLFKGSFYHHFASKEALMKAILETTRERLQTTVFSIAHNDTWLPPERLSKMLKKLGKTLLMPNGGCFIGNMTIQTANQVPEFAEILRGVFDDWIAAMSLIYQTKYPQEEAHRLAEIAVMEFQGAVMLSQVYKNYDFVTAVFKKSIDVLLNC